MNAEYVSVTLTNPYTGKALHEDLHLASVPRSGDVVFVRTDENYIRAYTCGPAAQHADPEGQKLGLWYPTVHIQATLLRRDLEPLSEPERVKRNELSQEGI